MADRGIVRGLVRASHPAPCVTVTTIAGLLALGAGAGAGTAALLAAAVLTGQLTIGWSNDLVDAPRDRASGRPDKPVATGQLPVPVLRAALLLACLATVALSALLGYAAALVHLVLVVGSGWAYNLGLKATVWSWLPYAVAFGSLPVVAWTATGRGWSLPPGWMVAVGALLGVGAHLLNVLPDLAEDEATGVRGLPHRLGARATRALAPLLLLTGSAVVALAPGGLLPVWRLAGFGVCLALAVVAWAGRGRLPFLAAMLLALANVGGLVAGA